MAHEVVVVGGGIGGLTVAALLASRGVDVCVFERQSQVGGCVAAIEKFGYTFDPTLGLYTCWDAGDIHPRIFSELPVPETETRPLNPGYVVRFDDGTDLALTPDDREFEEALRIAFPECAEAAVNFYKQSARINGQLLQALQRVPDLRTASRARRLSAFLPNVTAVKYLYPERMGTAKQYLGKTSERFQRFIELQLQSLADASLNDCAYPAACVALNIARKNVVSIKGGAAALAQQLAVSIKKSGGRVRLDSSVLRIAYDSSGVATGVDLLSGENVSATKAIVSNMTVWDTYGKLIGLERTPRELKARLSALKSRGVYLIFAGMDQAVNARLPASNLLVAANSSTQSESMIDDCGFAVSVAPQWDQRGPAGKCAVTISFPTEVDQWFTYHSDASEHETMDQAALELAWKTVHQRVPELGGGIEVIETATPITFYEITRRKLGMVGGLGGSIGVSGLASFTHETVLPNVFMVGDTTFPGAGISAVSHSALLLADALTR